MNAITTTNKAIVVPDENGKPLQLTPRHLENIQAQIAKGHSIQAIAVHLVIDVDSFVKACDEVPELKAVVQRGYILDEHEFSEKLRTKAHKMDSPQLVRLHASHKHGIEDKSAGNSGKTGVIIQIDTGINIKTPWQSDT